MLDTSLLNLLHAVSFGSLPSAICFSLSQRNFSPLSFPSFKGCSSLLQHGVPTDGDNFSSGFKLFLKGLRNEIEDKNKKGSINVLLD